MTKAVTRTHRGVTADARRAARGAAHREGRTLGEWLHNAIADQADDLGLHRSGGLEAPRSFQAGGDFRRRDAALNPSSRPAREAALDTSAPPSRTAWPKPPGEDAEDLEAALAMIQRRALRSERRTDEALATIAEMMESNESRRVQERDAVGALAHKMTHLETKLTDRLSTGDSPIKGALARLEARLDIIGKRTAAENAARSSAAGDLAPAPESVRRLEDKLNVILEAIQVQPSRAAEVSAIALQSAQRAEVSPRRNLGDALAEITSRQEMLDRSAPDRPPVSRNTVTEQPHLATRTGSRSDNARGDGPGQSIGSLEQEIRSISQRLDGLRADDAKRAAAPARVLTRPAAQRNSAVPAAASPSAAVDRAGLPARPGVVRPQAAPAPVLSHAAAEAAFEKIERRLETLVGRIDVLSRKEPVAVPVVAPTDTSALERLVRDLGAKIEAVRAPNADAETLDALQQQVERLSSRFERSEQGLAVLPTLAASVRELFDHLEATRANIEASAAHAAREVLRIAAGDRGRGEPAVSAEPPPARDLDAERPRAALNTMHSMLDEAVDRLSSLDAPVAPTARFGASGLDQPIPTTRPPAAGPALGLVDGARDPIVPLAPARATSAQTAARVDEAGVDLHRADFIAAARRAARTARGETVATTARRPVLSSADRDARAGLLAKSRDYVAAHKRPLLMGIAALVMVLGTLTLLQGTVGRGGGEEVAAKVDGQTPATRVASTAGEPSFPSRQPAAYSLNELTPSVLPKAAPLANPIPGSDPIQTGSIPALPAFAAAPPQPRQALPFGLKAAAEAGNGAAEYDLGTRYAEGRAVPRDMRAAAQWFEKAADQGLAPAQYRLASIYEKGVGVPQDKLKAKALYIQAAEAGNPRAMHNLAVLLADGDGHPDYAGAATWFRKAAAYGVHDSQYNLAILLARGLGVQQSLLQSYQWFTIAGAQDDADAARKRDEVGAKLTPNEVAVGKAFAAAFAPKVAEPTALDVLPPRGGWDGAAAASRLNTPKSKISSL